MIVYLDPVVPAHRRIGECACGRLAFRCRGGCLVIESRHGGETHRNTLSPAELRRLADILELRVDEDYHSMI